MFLATSADDDYKRSVSMIGVFFLETNYTSSTIDKCYG